MNKRYQVFVSSTYIDLTQERLEVIKALLELDAIPCGMEYFPAANEDSWTYIQSLIDQCDYYIVIIGGRYGSVTSDGISFTQKEFMYAQSKNIPCIGFIHAAPDEIPIKKHEKSAEGRERLQDFIEIVKRNLCKEWTTAHELGAVVSRSITQLMRRHPRTGWIPANQAADPKSAELIIQLTKQVSELTAEITRIRGLQSVNVDDLSDGDDQIDLSLFFVIKQKGKNKQFSQWIDSHKEQGTTKISWNDLFICIAPSMISFISETVARNLINKLLLEKTAYDMSKLKNGQVLTDVNIADKSFNIIKIQFVALGLIVIDKIDINSGGKSGYLWSLTDLGKARLTNSIAVKRKK